MRLLLIQNAICEPDPTRIPAAFGHYQASSEKQADRCQPNVRSEHLHVIDESDASQQKKFKKLGGSNPFEYPSKFESYQKPISNSIKATELEVKPQFDASEKDDPVSSQREGAQH